MRSRNNLDIQPILVIANESFHDTYGDIYEDDGNEMDVAEIFGDSDDDDHVRAVAMALTFSGVNTEHAQQVVSQCASMSQPHHSSKAMVDRSETKAS